MKTRVLVLGAGFGGLELCTILSRAMGDELDITLIDKNDSFVFGFSKIDIMFGLATSDSVRLGYSKISKPGVRFLRETVTKIDPEARRVTTNKGVYDADILVVALGADYDWAATPGLVEGSNEFYTARGAESIHQQLRNFYGGRVVVGVCSVPFKCPPAPSETVLMIHDFLVAKGIRNNCEITLVIPFSAPIPPSADASRALLSAFEERGIKFVPGKTVSALDANRGVALLDDGTELRYDVFLGVPKHRVPPVVEASGMTEDGWIPVSPDDLKTRFEGVYAIGDVTEVDVPKAGLFAEGAARVAAASIIADLLGGPRPLPYDGSGVCYIEWGSQVVGRVEVNFLSGPSATGKFAAPSTAVAGEKHDSASERRARWFGG